MSHEEWERRERALRFLLVGIPVLIQWLDRLALVDSFTDERQRMQARFVGAASCFGLLIASAAGFVLLTIDPPHALQAVIAAVVCLAVLIVWRLVKRTVVIAHLVGVTIATDYFIGAVAMNEAVNIALFVVLPLITLFLAGRRVGFAWLLVSMGLVALAAALTASNAVTTPTFLRTLLILPAVYFVGFVYDLGQEHVVARLLLAREVAESASREKSRFLAKVSHEIRTPLNGVLGTAELALLDDPPVKTREHLKTIQRSGGTLLGLINDLLDVARAEAGKFELVSTPFLPAALVTEVVELHRAAAQAKGLELKSRIDVPPGLTLMGDAVRVKQVLGNLLANAIKFTSAGDVSVSCEATREGSNHRLRLTVTDTGPGISERDQARLFLPFSQLQSDTQGTGLGLAISRQVIEAMRGRLLLTSEPGRGSTFGFEVLLAETDERLEHTPSALAWHFVGRVLVVDDNPVNVRVTKGLLEKVGLDTAVATDGAMALELLAKDRFDLVLMDLQMPKLGGVEATTALRARGDCTPVVALTASAMQEEIERCRCAGMQDYLTKPIRLPRLVETLLAHLPDVGRRGRLA